MQVGRIGFDIAKRVFQVHGVDEHGKVGVRKQLTRSKGLTYCAQLSACRIGREACGRAQYWGENYRS
jgi:transposase